MNDHSLFKNRLAPWSVPFVIQGLVSLATLLGFLSSPRAATAQLDLELEAVIDLSTVSSVIGGADFDDSTRRLWISDAGTLNTVIEMEPSTGTVVRSFQADVAGVSKGPDSLAIHPHTGNLFLFSPFAETIAGEITQAPQLVRTFPSAQGIAAASFDSSGTLYVLDHRTGALSKWDLDTGSLTDTKNLDLYSSWTSAANFDPITGHLFAYADNLSSLLEIDPETAAVLSVTDVSGFLTRDSFPTGIAFDHTGCRLFLIRGTSPDLLVLSRGFIASRTGSVNAATSSPRNVLFLNGEAGRDPDREVEYSVVAPFELRMIAPPEVPAGEKAPFAAYVWLEEPGVCTGRAAPFGIGTTALPMPITGAEEPTPVLIWNNAGRHRRLGVPTRSSEPAPTVFFRRRHGTRHAVRFFIQGLIYDPGSAGSVPASITNGIWAVPTFR